MILHYFLFVNGYAGNFIKFYFLFGGKGKNLFYIAKPRIQNLKFFLPLCYNIRMNVEFSDCLRGKTVAVAVSGGADSMALLHFTLSVAEKYGFSVVALNVEHGIRGESSLRDTMFVQEYCAERKIPLIKYAVNAAKKAKDDKLSVEQAARVLRYECFTDAIESGKCDAVFTAHHSSDNLESVLFNLFRGTGIKGLTGIKDFGGKIFRPFIKVSKAEIDEYIRANGIPFVTDETNLSDDYTRNFIRHNVIPEIKKFFPEAEKSVLRLSATLKDEDEFLDRQANAAVTVSKNAIYISLPLHRALLSRAVIAALKKLGVTRDYEKVHADDVCALCDKENGKSVDLPKGIKAVREYDRICFYRQKAVSGAEIPFAVGEFGLGENTVCILQVSAEDVAGEKIKSGLFADADKIPAGAVIRFRKSGDKFTKFGGGTKSLSDFLTDRKIPLKDRKDLPIIAAGNDVLAVFSVAVSDKIKVDGKTRSVIKFS